MNVILAGDYLKQAREKFKQLRLSEAIEHLDHAMECLEIDGRCEECGERHHCEAYRCGEPFYPFQWLCRSCARKNTPEA